jgi:predicted nucleic acid-binding protein
MPPATDKTPLVIDNDVFTHWRNSHQYVKKALAGYYAYHKQLPALTSITAFESLMGFRRDEKGDVEVGLSERFDRLQQLIGSMVVLPFGLRAAEIAGHIFSRLTRKQQKDLALDLLVTAIALANGCGVATRNKKDFDTIEAALPASLGPLYVAVWK